MSPRKKVTSKAFSIEVSGSGRQHEDELDVTGVMYDDTTKFLEKGELLSSGVIFIKCSRNKISLLMQKTKTNL
jgi:hypothetical protein